MRGWGRPSRGRLLASNNEVMCHLDAILQELHVLWVFRSVPMWYFELPHSTQGGSWAASQYPRGVLGCFTVAKGCHGLPHITKGASGAASQYPRGSWTVSQ